MPGADLARSGFGGSKLAINRRPLDCRAITPLAVYALPFAAVAAWAQAPSAHPSTYPTCTRPCLSTVASKKSSRFRQMSAPPCIQKQPRCSGSFGVASVVVQCNPPSNVLATYKCQIPLKLFADSSPDIVEP